MFKTVSNTLLLGSFILALFLTACGDSGGDDNPVPPPAGNNPDAPTVDQVIIDDESNSGNASDFLIKFIPPSDESDISEYRVILVKSSNVASFSLEDAIALPASAYQTVAPNGKIRQFNLSSALNDSDGVAIASGTDYRAFVISIANNTDEVDHSMSEGSNTLRLRSITTSIKISFMGAMGVVISDGTKQVIIDGLHSNVSGAAFTPVWGHNADLDALMNGDEPWGPSQILLNTHDHNDHFSATRANTFLSKHPNAMYISDQLARQGVSGNNVWQGTVDQFQSEEIVFDDIKVRVLHTIHYLAPLTENYAFLVEMGGKRILHLGDSDLTTANLSTLDYGTGPIDVVILTGNRINDAGKMAVDDFISPRNVILSHNLQGADKTSLTNFFPGSVAFTVAGEVVRY